MRCGDIGCNSLGKSKIRLVHPKTDFALIFFTKQINLRSLPLWYMYINGIKEYLYRVDSLVPLMHHDLSDLGLICLVKKTHFGFSASNLGFSQRNAPIMTVQCLTSSRISVCLRCNILATANARNFPTRYLLTAHSNKRRAIASSVADA